MYLRSQFFLLLTIMLGGATLSAQGDLPRDTFCVSIDTLGSSGPSLIGNVLVEAGYPPGGGEVFLLGELPNCLRLSTEGQLFFPTPPGPECCGEYAFRYRYQGEGCQNPDGCVGSVVVKVICPKPDCAFFDLGSLAALDDPSGEGNQNRACIPACENSVATYYLDYQTGYQYDWVAINGTVSYSPAPPAQVEVSWGAAGPLTQLQLVITGPDGNVETVDYCVDLTASPVADFTFDPLGCVNGEVCFNSTSIVGSGGSYLWDFGDGNYGTGATACHTYATGGTYTVTLAVTADGSPGCCCTDTVAYEIEIDPRPGPNIYWVSTLCEGDESVYWTDAENCDELTWTITDADGNILPFTPLNADGDSIVVSWGAGPFGTVSLVAEGCDVDYCPLGTTVTVPIISSLGVIAGENVVCLDDREVYSLPKWTGVKYQWVVTGGNIIGPDDGHQVTIEWTDPGNGTIIVEYGSEFLAGLPNHDGSGCFGRARLVVEVLGGFELNTFSNLGCITGNTFVQVTSDYPGATFNWSVSPGPVSFSTFASGISIDWSSGPGVGTYTVTASPLSPGPGDYCVGDQTLTITVVEVDPPAGIDGPDEYCPGDQDTYSVPGADPGLQYFWSITGGSLVSGNSTPNVVVNWTDPTSGTVTVFAYDNASFCSSEPVTFSANAIDLLPLTGINTTSGCTNTTESYAVLPTQHPATDFTWKVLPTTAGSVISGQGSPAVNIQWNEVPSGSATIRIVAELCGEKDSIDVPITLIVPVQPTVSQVGDLCPGLTATLTVGPGPFNAINWSTGETTASITVSGGGNYVVNTLDGANCPGVATFTPEELPGPDNQIAVAGPDSYCVNGNNNNPTGTTVDLLAYAQPGYSYQWFCNNTLQASTGPSLTHTVTNAAADFDYFFIVTDTNTGCVDTSEVRRIEQKVCSGGGPGCGGGNVTFTGTATLQTGDCSIVDLAATISAPVTNVQWLWPGGTPITVLSGSPSGPNLTVQFGEADCFVLTARHIFTATTGNTCFVDQLVTVCIPIVAAIDYVDSCGTVSFFDESTVLGGGTVASHSWAFGDGNTSTDEDPVHTYAGSGPYTVTLTVTDGQGCSATTTAIVEPGADLNPLIVVPVGPYCLGEAIPFGGVAPGAIVYNWDFGDGATFVGQNPTHAYATTGPQLVTLTVTDSSGCTTSTDLTLNVSPNPTPVVITATPGLIACEGETVTLSVPLEAGIAYLWSNGAPGNTISVTADGTFSVTLSTADGCLYESDSVNVSFLPPPPATVSGNPVICGGDPVTLSGPSGPFTYSWLNGVNVEVANTPTVTLGPGAIAGNPYVLVVTDANGCSATSDPINLVAAPSPPVAIVLDAGSGCEGEPNILAIDPSVYDAALIYSWSTGQSGPTTIAAAVGTYTVVALDPATGCSATDTYTIHPLPDVCIVPTGCYESCIPDTLCGPPGAGLTYQWYFDGNPVSTDQCYVATMSGAYYLEVTNEFGCVATTDSLLLDMIDCGDCADIETKIESLDETDCCYAFAYAGVPAGTMGVSVSSPDGDIVVTPGSIHPDYQPFFGPGSVQFGAATAGDPVPMNSPGAVAEFCLENTTVSPQLIVIAYLNEDFKPFCADSFYVECKPEPPCIYVTEDTLVCNDEGGFDLTLTVCRPLDADFEVGYLQLQPESPASAAALPLGILIAPPLSATNPCTTLVVSVPITDPGEEWCYSLVAHSGDPEEDPAALCCSGDEVYCLKTPDCDPCDDLGVIAVEPVGEEEDCCFLVELFSEVEEPILDGIALCPLDPGSTLTAFTQLGGDWVATNTSGGLVLDPTAGTLPTGKFTLPVICQDGNTDPIFEIEIKWLSGDSVVCRDTIEYKCEPDCGFLEEKEAFCEGGQFVWTGVVHNTSDHPMQSAYVEFEDGSGLSAYNTLYTFPVAVPSGGNAPITIVLGPPAEPGDSICVNVYLHELNDNEDHVNCCVFKDIIVMPDCEIDDCLCDEAFIKEVEAGFQVTRLNAEFRIRLEPLGDLTGCDSVAWSFRIPEEDPVFIGSGFVIAETFEKEGVYEICMDVFREDANGEECTRRVCRQVEIGDGPFVFPNPSGGVFAVAFDSDEQFGVNPLALDRNHFRITDLNGKPMRRWKALGTESDGRVYRFDLTALPSGVYFLRIDAGERTWVRRILLR